MLPIPHSGKTKKVDIGSDPTTEKVFSLYKPYLTLYEVFRLPKTLKIGEPSNH